MAQDACDKGPVSLEAGGMRTRNDSLLLLSLGLSRPWAPY